MLKKNAALALIFCLAAGSIFLSCNPATEAPEKKGPSPVYFDVHTFLQKQLIYLSHTNPKAEKTVTNGNLPPEKETINQVNWEKELAFFLEANINKDAWRETYKGDTLINKETGSRLYTYRSPAESDAWVKLLQVEVQENNRVKNIHLITRQHNPLFFAGRTLTITCNPAAPENPITAYQIKGVQKPVFADSLRYSVSARLVY